MKPWTPDQRIFSFLNCLNLENALLKKTKNLKEQSIYKLPRSIYKLPRSIYKLPRSIYKLPRSIYKLPRLFKKSQHFLQYTGMTRKLWNRKTTYRLKLLLQIVMGQSNCAVQTDQFQIISELSSV